jgi:hypothetical protein
MPKGPKYDFCRARLIEWKESVHAVIVQAHKLLTGNADVRTGLLAATERLVAPPNLMKWRHSSDASGAVCSTPSLNCALQMLANLPAPNWTALVAHSQIKGTVTFTDAKVPAFSKRFYHAVQAP